MATLPADPQKFFEKVAFAKKIDEKNYFFLVYTVQSGRVFHLPLPENDNNTYAIDGTL